MSRIKCPTCNRSNRAKRRVCGLCGEPIAHLRGPKGPATHPRTWEWPESGTRVSVTRTRHGWYDGRLSGTFTGGGCSGTVVDDEGWEHEICHPRDIY